MDKEQKIIDVFSEFGFGITKSQASKLKLYAEFLVYYNEKVNLTAITDFDEIILKHFVDSAMLLKYIDIDKNSISLIDVGTGAGFPSVVIKILNENIHLCLVDSLRKRIDFLNELCQKLELDKVETIHMRAEEISHIEGFREQFDIATARAVTNLRVLSELCIPLVKENGLFIPLKGSAINEEINESKNAIKVLGGQILDKNIYSLENFNDRGVVIIRKYRQTPSKYPRKWAKITKCPI